MNDPSPKKVVTFYKRLSNYASRFADSIKMRENSFVLTVAVFIGMIGGFGAVGIQYLIHEFQQLFWGGEFNLNTISNVSIVYRILIPTAGGIFVGFIIQYVAREAKGHGVPEVMEAIIMRNGIIRPRVVFAKLIASAIYIASGGSVGREGPVIQIGSAVGSAIGQFFRVNAKRMRTFVACGAASGIAAAFNAPVAGALFAVEVILGDFAVPQFSAVVISSVMATVISRTYLGDYPAFEVPEYQLGSPIELVFYVILGFLAAGVALLFIKILYRSEDFFDKKKWPEPVKAGLGGLGIGLIGIWLPQIYGVGYDTITSALNNTLIWQIALALIFVKIIATSLSLGSGGSGGVFAPSLFLGAMLGSSFGSLLTLLFPDLNISPGAYALVAMGGVVAAATHGPIAAILIIFEMSGDYKIMLPLMITCIISTVLAIKIREESIYTLKLKLRGINIFGGRELNVLKTLKVQDIYRKSVEIVKESETFPTILEKMASSQHSYFYVVDKSNKFVGSVSLNEIRRTILDYDHLKNLLIASDIMNPKVIAVHPEDNLDQVMKSFGQHNLDELPVVTKTNGEEILGSIWQHDVIETYNKQIFLRDMSGELGGGIRQTIDKKTVPVIDKYYLIHLEAPNVFIGKTLQELNLRSRFGADVLLIKKESEKGAIQTIQPDASYIIEMGDGLLIFGEKALLEKLEKI
jgi:CIC family chloride channel protein